MKKILSLVLALLMVTSMAVYGDSNFNDIEDSWAKDYIIKAADLKLINGKPDGNFEPKAEVTKFDAILMLTRLYNLDADVETKMLARNNSFLLGITNGKDAWAYNELSQAIELGIISKDGLRNMYADGSIKKAATREQVCILLSKALYLQDEVKNLEGKVYILPFGDASSISSDSRGYVYVIYKSDIISGNSAGNFDPRGSILREQLAKVICLAHDKVGTDKINPQYEGFEVFETVEGIIKDIKTNSIETTITLDVDDSSDDRMVRVVKGSTTITVDSKTSTVDKLVKGSHASCSVSEDTAIAKSVEVDSSISIIEATITGVYYSSPMRLVVRNANGTSATYSIADKVPVTVDGNSIFFRELVKMDQVSLTLVDDNVTKIDSMSRVKTHRGTIKEIVFDFPIKLIITDDNDKELEFTYETEPTIDKNGESSTFDSLTIGDLVTVSTTYDKLTAITANSNNQEGFAGMIKGITIGDVNKIKLLDNDGAMKEYVVEKSAKVVVLNQSASIYDLRLGYKIDVQFNGDNVISIIAKETESSQEVTGKILYVNQLKKTVMLQVIDDQNNKETIYAYLSNDTTIMNLRGSRLNLSDLESGQTVLCVGAYSGGNFSAVSVIVK